MGHIARRLTGIISSGFVRDFGIDRGLQLIEKVFLYLWNIDHESLLRVYMVDYSDNPSIRLIE